MSVHPAMTAHVLPCHNNQELLVYPSSEILGLLGDTNLSCGSFDYALALLMVTIVLSPFTERQSASCRRRSRDGVHVVIIQKGASVKDTNK